MQDRKATKTQGITECERIRKKRETLLKNENNKRRVIRKTVDND